MIGSIPDQSINETFHAHILGSQKAGDILYSTHTELQSYLNDS